LANKFFTLPLHKPDRRKSLLWSLDAN